MPGYIKSDKRTTEFTNQDCTLADGLLKFPLTDIRLKLELPEEAKVKVSDSNRIMRDSSY